VSRKAQGAVIAAIARVAIMGVVLLAAVFSAAGAQAANDDLSVELYYEIAGGGLAGGDESVPRGSDIRVFGIVTNKTDAEIDGAQSITLLAIRETPEPRIQEVLGHQPLGRIPAQQSLGLAASLWKTETLEPGRYTLKAVLSLSSDGGADLASDVPVIVEDEDDLVDTKDVLLTEEGEFLTFTGPAVFEIKTQLFEPTCLPGIALMDRDFMSVGASKVVLRLPVLNVGSVPLEIGHFILDVDALGLVTGTGSSYRPLWIDENHATMTLELAEAGVAGTSTKEYLFPGDEGVVKLTFDPGSISEQPLIDAFESVFYLPTHAYGEGLRLGDVLPLRIQLRFLNPNAENQAGTGPAAASPVLFVPSRTTTTSVSMRNDLWRFPIPDECDCGSFGTCTPETETWEFLYAPVRETPSSFFLATVRVTDENGSKNRIYRVNTDTGTEISYASLANVGTIVQPPVAAWSVSRVPLGPDQIVTTRVFAAVENGLITIPVNSVTQSLGEASLVPGVGNVTQPLAVYRDTVYAATDEGLVAVDGNGDIKWTIPAGEVGGTITLGPVVTRWDGASVYSDRTVVWFLVDDVLHMVVDTEQLDDDDGIADLDSSVHASDILDMDTPLISTPVLLSTSGGFRIKDESIAGESTGVEDPWRVYVVYRTGATTRVRSVRVTYDSQEGGSVGFQDVGDPTAINNDLIRAESVYGVSGNAGDAGGSGDFIYVYWNRGIYAYTVENGQYVGRSSMPGEYTAATWGGPFLNPAVLNTAAAEAEAVFAFAHGQDPQRKAFIGLDPTELETLTGCPWPDRWAAEDGAEDSAYPALRYELEWPDDLTPLGPPVIIERASDWAVVLVASAEEIRAFQFPDVVFTQPQDTTVCD
jgi:hypothetical protein